MRFDNIAQAAVTPGGFQGGVNDIIQAILGADAAKQRAAMHEQDAAMAQQNMDADRAWRKESLGQQMANSQADRGMRQQEIDNTKRHYADQAAQKGLENFGDGLDRVGAFGKNIYQMMSGTGDYKPATSARSSAANKPMSHSDAVAQANFEIYGDSDGYKVEEDQTEPLTEFGMVQRNADGTPIMLNKGKKVRPSIPPADKAKMVQDRVRQLVGQRSMGAQVADGMDLGEDIPATTEGAAPIGQVLQKPAIDYNALDAKLQSSTSALGNAYRQFRSGPANDWKGWLTKNKALVDSDTGAPAPK